MNEELRNDILQAQYDAHDSELDADLERKVNSMSNLGEYAVEYGYRKGMQRGKEEGLHNGRETVIISMLRKHISSAEIASMTDIPLETVREIEQRMMAASL